MFNEDGLTGRIMVGATIARGGFNVHLYDVDVYVVRVNLRESPARLTIRQEQDHSREITIPSKEFNKGLIYQFVDEV